MDRELLNSYFKQSRKRRYRVSKIGNGNTEIPGLSIKSGDLEVGRSPRWRPLLRRAWDNLLKLSSAFPQPSRSEPTTSDRNGKSFPNQIAMTRLESGWSGRVDNPSTSLRSLHAFSLVPVKIVAIFASPLSQREGATMLRKSILIVSVSKRLQVFDRPANDRKVTHPRRGQVGLPMVRWVIFGITAPSFVMDPSSGWNRSL